MTEKGEAILRGRETDCAPRRRPRQPPRRAERVADARAASPISMRRRRALFEHLRALRLEIARSEAIAAYMVFADRTLIDMARLRPRDARRR